MTIKQRVNWFFDRYEAPWEIFMIVLALIFVAIGFLPDWVRLTPRQFDILTWVDYGITAVFILEFVVRFAAADSGKSYVKNHWLDLLSVVPLIRWLRVVRIVRVLRLLRLARIIDSLEALGVSFAHFAKLNGLQWMLMVLTGLMLGLSFVFYFAETGTNAEVNSYWDAFYTSIITWAGAGCGEITPVTVVGRICGILLVVSGVTAWGLVIGNLSAFFTSVNSERLKAGVPKPNLIEGNTPDDKLA